MAAEVKPDSAQLKTRVLKYFRKESKALPYALFLEIALSKNALCLYSCKFTKDL
jgi:hypothetical protein